MHYVSTTAVLAGLGVEGIREVTEETPLGYPEQLRMGYVETKYVAEELLRNAGRAGLPVAIYRPLDIVGSIGTGAWSTSTEMCALIRFMTDTGLAPDIDLPLDYVPADVCAAAIRHISVTEGATGRTYHLASPEHALLGVLVGRLRDRGYRIDDVASATGSASSPGRPRSTRRTRWRRSCRCSSTGTARPGSRWRRCTSRTCSRPTAAPTPSARCAAAASPSRPSTAG